MRHRKTINILNRPAEHRKVLLANLAGSLFEKKRIKTTHAKAKAAQQFVERLITIAKSDTLHARRLVLSRVRHKSVMQLLFNDVAPTYSDRNGGYTRVMRLGRRPGDGAEVSILELVGFEEAMKKRAKDKKEKAAKATKETTPEVKKDEKTSPDTEKNVEDGKIIAAQEDTVEEGKEKISTEDSDSSSEETDNPEQKKS